MVVLFVMGLVDRIEHGLLAGVPPLLQSEWGVSDTVAGAIPTAAALAATAVALPAGYLAASLADVVVAASRGLGFALLQLCITAGAAFGPLVVGIASDRSGSLATAMYVLTVPMVLGGLLSLGGPRLLRAGRPAGPGQRPRGDRRLTWGTAGLANSERPLPRRSEGAS